MRSWRDFIRSLAVFVALVACTVAVSAQQGRNAINGMVVNSGREPINRIRVELQNELEMFITYTYTDAAGRYSFRNLSQGVFIVKVHTDGKHTGQSTRVVLQALRNSGASHYEQIDFMLKEITEKKLTTLSGTTSTVFAQEVPEKARKIYDRAVKQLDNAQEKTAGIASLKEALQTFPRYYDALERLGIEYVRLQQYEEARQILTLAIDVNRSGSASLYGLGVAQFHTQRTAEAVESLQRALIIAPDSSNSAFEHFYLGLSYWKLNRHGDAEPHLKKAGELGGNSVPPDIHMYLAQYYSESGRRQDAAAELELFLKLVPNAQDAEKIRNLIRQLKSKQQ
jgi:tetratricopeptide (TPR) repeat protein